MVLEASTQDGSTILEPHLEILLGVIFPQVHMFSYRYEIV